MSYDLPVEMGNQELVESIYRKNFVGKMAEEQFGDSVRIVGTRGSGKQERVRYVKISKLL